MSRPFSLAHHQPQQTPLCQLTKHEQVRVQRDLLLRTVSDILQRHSNQVNFGVHPSIDPDHIQDVANYAQRLRDVPQQPSFPDVVWPKVPKCIRALIVS